MCWNSLECMNVMEVLLNLAVQRLLFIIYFNLNLIGESLHISHQLSVLL